ncbi:MAG TPA: hypothetical protein VGG03_02005, partial [Thermoanaerobaculia bacterium]
MRKPSRKLWLLSAALMIALALLGLEARASTQIPEGTDCWHTEPGTPGTQAILTIPKDALGAGSKMMNKVTIKLKSLPLTPAVVKTDCGCQVNTKVEYIDPHGNVSGEKTIHAVKQRTTETTDVDTCVRRTQNAKFKGKGVAVRVDIQLVKLSLQSEQPLKVSYDNGTTKSFNIIVTESGPQDTGSMTITPTSIGRLSKGNVKLQNLHITYK